MKRLFICLLAICMLLTACSSPQFTGDLPDFQYQFKRLGAQEPTQESENGYYNICNGVIVFTDKSTMKSVPLCPRPDCTHDGMSTDCPARINDVIICYDNFQYYRGRLYRVGAEFEPDPPREKHVLRSMEPDGSDRDVVLTFDDYVIDWFIVDGWCYYQPMNEDGADADKLYRVSLNGGKRELFTDFSQTKEIFHAEASFRSVYRGFAYFTLYGYRNEHDYQRLLDGAEVSSLDPICCIARVDLSSGMFTKISPYEDYDLVGFSGDLLVGVSDGAVILSALDGSDPHVICPAQNSIVRCDEEYLYLIPNGEQTVTALDMTGKRIATATLPDALNGSRYNLLFYDNYIWFESYTEDGQYALCYIKKADLLQDGAVVPYEKTYLY